jgi:hypothetical protein
MLYKKDMEHFVRGRASWFWICVSRHMIEDDERNHRTLDKDCELRRDMQTGMQRSKRAVK